MGKRFLRRLNENQKGEKRKSKKKKQLSGFEGGGAFRGKFLFFLR